jgi:hypothetical protein
MAEGQMKPEAAAGLALIGAMTTGLAALLLATWLLVRSDGGGAAIALVAAALAFGLAANAVLRN